MPPPPPPPLRHIHLPGLTSYHHASAIQSHLVSQFLAYKKLLSSTSPTTSKAPPAPPPPTILTFTPHPIYTTGRRDTKANSSNPLSLTPSQLAALTAPFPPLPSSSSSSPSPSSTTKSPKAEKADIFPALRGGQTTFHGPGQLVIYPLLSLSHPPSFPNRKPISPRCYVHLLEGVTIATLAKYNIRGVRTENPGVWFDGLLGDEDPQNGGRKEPEDKIAALGIHLRRFVTSHGVAINVDTDLRWFERIVACGLEGKGTMSMRAVLGDDGFKEKEIDVEGVARAWVSEFAGEVGVESGSVVEVGEEEVLDGVELEER